MVRHGAAHYLFHDLAGWLMMPLALVLLWAELRLVSFLFAALPADKPIGVLPAPSAASPPAVKAPARSQRKKKAGWATPSQTRPAGQA